MVVPFIEMSPFARRAVSFGGERGALRAMAPRMQEIASFLSVARWLGLWSGVVFVLVTLSGSGVRENSLPLLRRGGLGGGATSGVLVTHSGGGVGHNTRYM